jgi:hypothetical protein
MFYQSRKKSGVCRSNQETSGDMKSQERFLRKGWKHFEDLGERGEKILGNSKTFRLETFFLLIYLYPSYRFVVDRFLLFSFILVLFLMLQSITRVWSSKVSRRCAVAAIVSGSFLLDFSLTLTSFIGSIVPWCVFCFD